MSRCYICRTASNDLARLSDKHAKTSGRLYSRIIQEDLIAPNFEHNFNDTELICQACSLLLEKRDALKTETLQISNILQRLIYKRINIDNDDEELQIDVDEIVFQYFRQVKSKFLCKMCDFGSRVFEALSAHVKYHQIMEANQAVDAKPVKVKPEISTPKPAVVTRATSPMLFEESIEMTEYEELDDENKETPYKMETIEVRHDEHEYVDESHYQTDNYEAGSDVEVAQQFEFEMVDCSHSQEYMTHKTRTYLKSEKRERTAQDGSYKVYACDLCTKSFKTHSSLIYHMMTHTNEYPFYCSFCHKGCKHEHQLKEHENTHKREPKYTCNICGKDFINQGTFHHHKRWHEEPLVRV